MKKKKADKKEKNNQEKDVQGRGKGLTNQESIEKDQMTGNQAPGLPADWGLIEQGVDKDRTPRDEDEEPFEVVIENESADEYLEEISQYTSDEDIAEDFAERQGLNTGGEELLNQLREHTFQSPEQSGGDIDANWQDSIVTGEESIGGMNPTPGQNSVDDIGQGTGLTFEEEEPLHDKLNERDRHRWELDPRSADDTETRGNPCNEEDEESSDDINP